MASVHYDSELMTNYVAAVPVPGSSRFTTCLDPETQTPVVFALNNDKIPKLQMIKQGYNGLRQLHDISGLLQIPDATPIQTFDVQQAADLKVYMVVATKYDETRSNLLIVKPFEISAKPRLSYLPVKTVGLVHRIFMSPPSLGNNYPMVFAAHQPIGSVTKGSDITRLAVSLESNSWNTLRDMELPANAVDIFSIAPAKSVFGDGLFVLCAIKESSERTIIAEFVRKEDGAPIWYTTQLKCPAGANNLATFTNKSGYSALLVACEDGLRYFAATQTTDKRANSSLICSDPLFTKSRDIVVAQDGEALSIWATNAKGRLSYINTTISSIGQERVNAIPLLEDGRSSSFSACITQPNPEQGRPNVWQAVIANDDNGNLTLLQQHKDTGIWRPEPFIITYAKKNIKVESYTISIQLTDASSKALSNGQLFIRSSSTVAAMLNGRVEPLSSTGTWLNADDAGELSLIVPTSTVSGQTFTLTKVRGSDGTELEFKQMILDPSRKVMQTFSQLTSVEKLKMASTKSSKPLWEAKDMPSDADLEQAAKCFKAIHEAMLALPVDGSSIVKVANKAVVISQATSNQAVEDVGELLMDGFYWVKQKLRDAVDWVIQKFGDVWQFVCKIGNTIKTFVLDCLEKIGEAASWVFEKIKLGWEKIKELAGFLFNWSDILETKNSIKAVLNAGIDMGAEKVDEFVPKIDGFFAGLQEQIVQNLTPSSKTINNAEGNKLDGKAKDIQSSTSYKWTGERLKNGGVGAGGAVIQSKDNADRQTADSWENDFKPLLESIEAAATQTGNDIATLFKKEGSMTTEDLLFTGSKFLVNVLEVLKQFTITLAKSIRRLLKLLRELGNKRIDLWIFSDLYETLTGNELTLFDAVSLIIAIPTCIMIKAVTRAKPPNFAQLDSKLLGQLVSGDKDLPVSTRLDWSTFTSGMALGIVSIKGIFGLIKLAYKALTEGADAALGTFSPGKTMQTISVVLDILGIINAMPTDAALPAPKLRQWIAVLSLIRAGTNGLGLIIPENQLMEKVGLCVDLVVTLANFGLYQAVYYYELEEPWDDKDEETTNLCIVGNGLNAIAGIGSFTANMGKIKAPYMTAIGVVAMTAGTYGLLAMEGFMFERQYEKEKPTRVIAPAF